jgi:hypothetical protein
VFRPEYVIVRQYRVPKCIRRVLDSVLPGGGLFQSKHVVTKFSYIYWTSLFVVDGIILCYRWYHNGMLSSYWNRPWMLRGEQRYSSTLSLTSALYGGGWSTSRLGHFTPGKETQYPLYGRLGGAQGRCRRVRKISAPPPPLPPGFDLRTFQPLESRCTG